MHPHSRRTWVRPSCRFIPAVLVLLRLRGRTSEASAHLPIRRGFGLGSGDGSREVSPQPSSKCVSFHAVTGPSRHSRGLPVVLSRCITLIDGAVPNSVHSPDSPTSSISPILLHRLHRNGRPGGARTRTHPATSGSTVVPTYSDSHGAERYNSATCHLRSTSSGSFRGEKCRWPKTPLHRCSTDRPKTYISRPDTRLPPFGDPDLLRTALSLRTDAQGFAL